MNSKNEIYLYKTLKNGIVYYLEPYDSEISHAISEAVISVSCYEIGILLCFPNYAI